MQSGNGRLRRIVIKTGLIRRTTMEMNRSKVESVAVHQGIMGRLFDYGTVVVKGTGGGMEPLSTIEHPLANHPKDSRRVLACVHPRDVMRLRPRQARTELRVQDRGTRWAIVEALARTRVAAVEAVFATLAALFTAFAAIVFAVFAPRAIDFVTFFIFAMLRYAWALSQKNAALSKTTKATIDQPQLWS